MKLIGTLFLLALGVGAFAQNDQADINNQVWKPFTKAIMSQDVPGFIAVHSKDVVRAELTDNQVQNYAEYQASMEKSWPGWKESIQKNNSKYIFELRFLQRISNGSLAYEVGYFKNESVNAKGERRMYFGKFQVALRKENGTWKILVDSDSNEGNTITEAMFLQAKPLE